MRAIQFVRFVLPGEPKSLLRPRISKKGKLYDTQKSLKHKLAILIKNQLCGAMFLEGPLRLEVIFCFAKSRRRTDSDYYHIYRPDLSNLIKLIEDVCTRLLYHDDCQIAQIQAIKVYSSPARTEFTVTQI
jgi:Holliday junction resolvase RusA-like endonuclease